MGVTVRPETDHGRKLARLGNTNWLNLMLPIDLAESEVVPSESYLSSASWNYIRVETCFGCQIPRLTNQSTLRNTECYHETFGGHHENSPTVIAAVIMVKSGKRCGKSPVAGDVGLRSSIDESVIYHWSVISLRRNCLK